MICPACAAAIPADVSTIYGFEAGLAQASLDIKAKLKATFAAMTKDGQGLSRSQVETILSGLEVPDK